MDKNEKEMIEGEVKKLHALKDVADLDGVKELVFESKSIVLATLEQLSTKYVELQDIELRSLCATLTANLEIYQRLTGLDDKIAALEKVLE